MIEYNQGSVFWGFILFLVITLFEVILYIYRKKSKKSSTYKGALNAIKVTKRFILAGVSVIVIYWLINLILWSEIGINHLIIRGFIGGVYWPALDLFLTKRYLKKSKLDENFAEGLTAK